MLGADTHTPPTYCQLFNYVVRIELYSISSYLLYFLSKEDINIFSDLVVLFAPGANETHLKHAYLCHDVGRAQSSVTNIIIILWRMRHRGIVCFGAYFIYFVHFIDWYAFSRGTFLRSHLCC